MHCSNCDSKNIKKRKNYTHGSSSKGKLSYSCRDCNSNNIIIEKVSNFRRR